MLFILSLIKVMNLSVTFLLFKQRELKSLKGQTDHKSENAEHKVSLNCFYTTIPCVTVKADS